MKHFIFNIFDLIHLFLTTSFFATSLSLLKSTGAGTNLSISNLSTLLLELLKLAGIFFNLGIVHLLSHEVGGGEVITHFAISFSPCE